MLTALTTALTAMDAETTAIDVTGNNLANLNTTGYKASTVSFYDLMSQTLGSGASSQVGTGLETPLTNTAFTTGTIQSSSSPTDVAIQGNGFLIVTTASGATEYTRDGNLKVDKTGQLTTATGELVQGYMGTSTTGSPTGITVPTGTLKPAVPTANMTLNANLDSTSAVVTTPSASNVSYSTSVQVYDSLGNSHQVTLDFWNTGSGKWTYDAVLDGATPKLGTGAGTDANQGTLTFGTSGNLTDATYGASSTTDLVTTTSGQITAVTEPALAFSPTGAAGMTVNFNLFTTSTSNSGATVFTPNITQYAQTSGVSSESQDGSAAVNLSTVSIANGGAVMATYSDGEQLQVGTLAMANFVNPDSLIAVGDNNFQVSGDSSAPAVGVPNSEGRGQIIGSSLEASNVDIATEFTNLISYQNSYEAASRVISTAS
ncbi:MAG TPA: flagellar hook-basal body complex protein, partial [Bryobacteraceae bacterium]|nr:flagellar hook-basal body complex protein [Bryobacteraceae bacterium]